MNEELAVEAIRKNDYEALKVLNLTQNERKQLFEFAILDSSSVFISKMIADDFYPEGDITLYVYNPLDRKYPPPKCHKIDIVKIPNIKHFDEITLETRPYKISIFLRNNKLSDQIDPIILNHFWKTFLRHSLKTKNMKLFKEILSQHNDIEDLYNILFFKARDEYAKEVLDLMTDEQRDNFLAIYTLSSIIIYLDKEFVKFLFKNYKMSLEGKDMSGNTCLKILKAYRYTNSEIYGIECLTNDKVKLNYPRSKHLIEFLLD